MSTPPLAGPLKAAGIVSYTIAVLSSAAAVAAALAFERFWGSTPQTSLFICLIMFVAWVYGTGPALLATALVVLAFDYFFLPPVYSFVVELKEIPRLVLFIAAALLAVWLSAAQRRAADALRESEAELAHTKEELQFTIDSIPALVATYKADGTRSFVNQPWLSYSGLTLQNVIGESGVILVHPEDAEAAENAWHASLASGDSLKLEVRVRRADGEYRWHNIQRVPRRDDNGEIVAWYSAGFDIEDRKSAEDAQRRSEAELTQAKRELQQMVDTIPVFVATYRPDGTRSFVNQSWQDYMGLSLQDAAGKTFPHFHPDDAAQEAWRAALATGEPLRMEVRVRRADGEYRWHTSRRIPLRDESGDIIRWYSVGIDIEDQKRAEAALRASEAQLAEARRQLQLTIDTIPVLVGALRPDGKLDFVNQTYRDYTGLSIQEATGGRRSDFHPDEAERIQTGWRASLATGLPFQMELRLRRHDGIYRWHNLRRVPLRDENGDIVKWYGVAFDIEDRKQAESALQRGEAYSAEAQKLSQTGSFAWEIASDVHFWSDQTYQIMGFDRGIKPSLDLIIQRVHPDDRELLRREAERAAQGAQSHDYEQRLLMPDGQIKYLHVRAHRVKYESGKEEIVGALMEVTQAKRSQEALEAARTALAHANRVATLGEMSASIAHEVNQPLAAIVANGQACLRFLQREIPDLNEVRGAVGWIVKDGNRAAEVIHRVRGLLKKEDTQKAPLNINDTINEVVALLQRELMAQNVVYRRELASAMPLVVVDRVQLQQVIINLVMNGIEAMQAVTGRPRALVIRSHMDEMQVVVAVTDSGVGLPSETTNRVFDAFFSTKPSGLGMGLSICRSIIEDHGGRLWATDNGEAPGATFQFTLPACQDGTD